MKFVSTLLDYFKPLPPVLEPDTGIPPAGAKMDDGTVYAGLCPRTGRPMYATPEDTGCRNMFDKTLLKLEFNGAAHAPRELNEAKKFGHSDWLLPDQEQMGVMAKRKNRIGGFEPGAWYWTSSELSGSNAWMAYLGEGLGVSNQNKGSTARVRCIRLGEIPPPPPPEPPFSVHIDAPLTVRRPLQLKL